MTIQQIATFSIGAPITGQALAFGQCPNLNSGTVQSLGGGLVLDCVYNKLYQYSLSGITEYAALGASQVVQQLSVGADYVNGAASAAVKGGYYVLGSNGSALQIKQTKTGWQTQPVFAPGPFVSSFATKYGLGAYSARLYNESYEMPPGVPGQFYIGQSGTVSNNGNGGYGTVAYSPSGEIITSVLQTAGSLHVCKGGAAFWFGSTDSGFLLSLNGTGIALPAPYVSCYYFGSWPEGDVFVLETADRLVAPFLYDGSYILSPIELTGDPVYTALTDFGSSSSSSTVGTTLGAYGAILGITGVTPAGWLIDLNLSPASGYPLIPFPAVRKPYCFCSKPYARAVESTY